ncbi:MAG: rhodanese-like domain-containing protein [Parasporobacterium sp.]|nr:rhodanese-like domain-containing protein [Parasporobacterium sp.]
MVNTEFTDDTEITENSESKLSSGDAEQTADAFSKTASDEEPIMNSYKQITQAEAWDIMNTGTEDYIILDVRRQDEYDAGHIPGAICVPNETINDAPPEELPDKDQLILVYCRSGRRSKEAAQKLADMGYTNIQEFGGIIDWIYDTCI